MIPKTLRPFSYSSSAKAYGTAMVNFRSVLHDTEISCSIAAVDQAGCIFFLIRFSIQTNLPMP